MKKKKNLEMPSQEVIEKELERVKRRRENRTGFRRTVYALATVSAVAILVAILFLPVLRIYGNSMTPTLYEGEVVFSMKTKEFEPGDVVAFSYNNNILVKRVIASAGEWVDIAEDGTVFVNEVELYEPYVKEKAYGDCNIELPYQVPDERVFVIGDHRATSVDSRNTSIGCVSMDQIVGKIVFRIWPLNRFGKVS